MLIKCVCVHIRSATTQHAAEVLRGIPLGAIITTAFKKKRGGGAVAQRLALPSSLHKSNPLQLNGPQIRRDGQFVADVYDASSTKGRGFPLDTSIMYDGECLRCITAKCPAGKSVYKIRSEDAEWEGGFSLVQQWAIYSIHKY